MIPKIIHYCWFGRGPKPELALKCIESWKEFCPDYTLMEWNEDSFDITSNQYVKEAYEARKFAFVSDYVRLFALYTVGGIYMDTDVMVKKPLDPYLHHEAFFSFESKTHVSTGIMATKKEHSLFGELLSYYDTAKFLNEDGSFNLKTNVEALTPMFIERGLLPTGKYQQIEGITFYPQNIFSPDHKKLKNARYMADTVTIHYFAGSWKSEKTVKREKSLWWKIIAIPGMKISKLMTALFGDKWTKAKNRLRDRLFGEK